MPSINNRLIIPAFFLLLAVGLAIPCTASTPIYVITKISGKMAISVKDSDINYELSDIYIPNPIIADAVSKANTVALGRTFNFLNISDMQGRNGNFYATIVNPSDKKSLQESLLENGLGFAYFTESSENVSALFAAEKRGRDSKSGIWKSFDINNSNEISKDYKEILNKFIILSGVVNNIYSTKKDTYINFGADWKTDFSAQIENKILKQHKDFSVEKLKGKKISVRGWLEDYNGPLMKIYHPANIEVGG